MKRDRIRWGFLSTAAIGREAMGPAIRQSRNGVLQAVGSRDLVKAEAMAAQLGFARAHGSYEAVLADPEVDAVYIPLPNAMHAEWAMRAADAGKAVLCEKPLAVSAAEAGRMAAHCRERGVLLVESFMFRHHPLTRKAVALVREGRIGRMLAVRSSFFGVEGKPADDIRFSKALGGGALADLGCYCVAVMRLLVGEEPVEVTAVADYLSSGVDGRLSGVMKFPGGVVGEFGCGLEAPFSCTYEVVGTGGRLLVDHGGMVVWPGGEFVIKLWTKSGYEELKIAPANHYQLIAEAFAEALLEGRAPEFSAEDAVANLVVMDRLRDQAARWRSGA